MTDENEERTDETPEGPGATPDDIKTEPPGNPEVDEEAVEKGNDQLGRVKPY